MKKLHEFNKGKRMLPNERNGDLQEQLGYTGLFRNISGHTGPHWALVDHTGPYRIIRDHKEPNGAIGDSMGPFGTTKDNIRTIRDHRES